MYHKIAKNFARFIISKNQTWIKNPIQSQTKTLKNLINNITFFFLMWVGLYLKGQRKTYSNDQIVETIQQNVRILLISE